MPLTLILLVLVISSDGKLTLKWLRTDNVPSVRLEHGWSASVGPVGVGAFIVWGAIITPSEDNRQYLINYCNEATKK